jgi:hypothetical protein
MNDFQVSTVLLIEVYSGNGGNPGTEHGDEREIKNFGLMVDG